MHALLTMLTAALLAGHAFVGCCWREHAGLGHAGPCAACQSSAGDLDQHGAHGCCPADSPESPAPCSCRIECQQLCQYVSPERTLSAIDADLVALVAILPPSVQLGQACQSATESRPPGWPDPQRIQLQHQILLI